MQSILKVIITWINIYIYTILWLPVKLNIKISYKNVKYILIKKNQICNHSIKKKIRVTT